MLGSLLRRKLTALVLCLPFSGEIHDPVRAALTDYHRIQVCSTACRVGLMELTAFTRALVHVWWHWSSPWSSSG